MAEISNKILLALFLILLALWYSQASRQIIYDIMNTVFVDIDPSTVLAIIEVFNAIRSVLFPIIVIVLVTALAIRTVSYLREIGVLKK